MIVHPSLERHRLSTFHGTRILRNDFNLLGQSIRDPYVSTREWSIVGVYAPLSCRAVGGIRVKVADVNGTIAFVEQMDLEVLMGLAKPDNLCAWSSKRYVGPGDRSFVGLACDDDDLLDDLLDTENIIRQTAPVIPEGTSIDRSVYLEFGSEWEESWRMMWDGDSSTNTVPDLKFETLERRWKRISRNRIRR